MTDPTNPPEETLRHRVDLAKALEEELADYLVQMNAMLELLALHSEHENCKGYWCAASSIITPLERMSAAELRVMLIAALHRIKYDEGVIENIQQIIKSVPREVMQA